MPGAPSSVLATSSDALVSNSFLFLLVRHLLLLAMHLLLVASYPPQVMIELGINPKWNCQRVFHRTKGEVAGAILTSAIGSKSSIDFHKQDSLFVNSMTQYQYD